MKKCWNGLSNERPSFYEIAARLNMRINKGEIPNISNNPTTIDPISEGEDNIRSAEYVNEIIGKHSSYLISKQLVKEKQLAFPNQLQRNDSSKEKNNEGKSKDNKKISEILNACEERDSDARKNVIIRPGKKTAPKRILGTLVSKTVEQIEKEHAFRIPVED